MQMETVKEKQATLVESLSNCPNQQIEKTSVFAVNAGIANAVDYMCEAFNQVLQIKLVNAGFDEIQIALTRKLLCDLTLQNFPSGGFHALSAIESYIQKVFRDKELLPGLDI